jgi:septal ring factor EnvC (AmiA/AmiB activator)
MALSIDDVERDVAQQRAEVERLRHEVECFERGTQEHRAAIARLDAAETSLIADTKLLIFIRRRFAFFRALNAQDFMAPPQVTE